MAVAGHDVAMASGRPLSHCRAAAVSPPCGARHPLPTGNTFPISAAEEAPSGKTTAYRSGTVPKVADPAAAAGTVAAYGDTRTQTISVLTSIQAQRKALGLGRGDVVKMQVFLVGDPGKDGKLDFAGMTEGYSQFFGTKQRRGALRPVQQGGPRLHFKQAPGLGRIARG